MVKTNFSGGGTSVLESFSNMTPFRYATVTESLTITQGGTLIGDVALSGWFSTGSTSFDATITITKNGTSIGSLVYDEMGSTGYNDIGQIVYSVKESVSSGDVISITYENSVTASSYNIKAVASYFFNVIG